MEDIRTNPDISPAAKKAFVPEPPAEDSDED